MYARLRGDISSTADLRVKGRNVDRFSALRSPPWPLRSSGVASPSPGSTSVGSSFLGCCGGSGSGSGGGLTRRRSRLARCLRVVETALGLMPLLLGDGVALELGLRGDGRLWQGQGGAVTAADMGASASSSSSEKLRERSGESAQTSCLFLSLWVQHAGEVRCLIGSAQRGRGRGS
jgi:hypothetical protein